MFFFLSRFIRFRFALYNYLHLHRHNNGHVTRVQFRQCLSILELTATAEEMKALEAKFCNDVGFNYLAFLEELHPTAKRTLMYIKVRYCCCWAVDAQRVFSS